MPPAKKAAKTAAGNRQPAGHKSRGRPKRVAVFTTEPCHTPEPTTRTAKRKAADHTPEPTPQRAEPQAQTESVTNNDLRSMMDQMREFQVSMITRMVALEERPATRAQPQQYPDQQEPDSSDAESTAPCRPRVTRPAPPAQADPDYPPQVPAPRRVRKEVCVPVTYDDFLVTPRNNLHSAVDSCATVNRRKQFARPIESEVTRTDQAVTVSELLHAAGNAMGKKQGKNSLLPRLFVLRGHKREKVAYGEATWHEYIAALCKMMN